MATRKRSTSRATSRLAPDLRPGRIAAEEPRAPARPVLVATDGSRSAAAAIKFARALEQDGAWIPEAVTVTEHLPIAIADVALPVPVVVADPDVTAGAVNVVRRQVRRLGGKSWEFGSEVGTAAIVIPEFAKLRAVALIVLGLGKHGKLARLFGAETAARVCRYATVPVLAVDQSARGRPGTIVVAMDFGASSVRAAREALALVKPGGRLHLLHVRWALNGRPLRDDAWERTYALGVERGFQRLLEELERPGVRVTTEMHFGGVLESILERAKELDADVIAAGSHSQTFVDRLLLGSTPAHLLRAAKCSVLVAPPTPE